MVRHGDFFGHNIMVTFFSHSSALSEPLKGRSSTFLFSLRYLSVDSPHLLCQKLNIVFYILIANAKATWVELPICGMDEKLKVCYREEKHMEVKRKTHLIFYFFRKMAIKTIKRAKLKPFNPSSCRSAECSPTLRSCLTHPLQVLPGVSDVL